MQLRKAAERGGLPDLEARLAAVDSALLQLRERFYADRQQRLASGLAAADSDAQSSGEEPGDIAYGGDDTGEANRGEDGHSVDAADGAEGTGVSAQGRPAGARTAAARTGKAGTLPGRRLTYLNTTLLMLPAAQLRDKLVHLWRGRMKTQLQVRLTHAPPRLSRRTRTPHSPRPGSTQAVPRLSRRTRTPHSPRPGSTQAVPCEAHALPQRAPLPPQLGIHSRQAALRLQGLAASGLIAQADVAAAVHAVEQAALDTRETLVATRRQQAARAQPGDGPSLPLYLSRAWLLALRGEHSGDEGPVAAAAWMARVAEAMGRQLLGRSASPAIVKDHALELRKHLRVRPRSEITDMHCPSHN
jgi:hypothetical protein